MLKIAIISDDDGLFEQLKPLLTRRGYQVNLYRLSKDNINETLIEDKNDLLIVDFYSSPESSRSILKELDKNDNISSTYCISIFDEDPGDDFDFGYGIDDFIFRESIEKDISLRIRLFQWKSNKVDSKDRIIVSDFVIDSANYEVAFKGKKVDLTFKEFELLKFLVTHTGRVYSRDSLLNQVWGYNYYGGTRTVDVHIRRLRAKIGIEIDNYLKTIRNVGYKFEA